MNKHIRRAFPEWAIPFHKNIAKSFYNVAQSHFKKHSSDAKLIMDTDFPDTSHNAFFTDRTINIKDDSWLGKSVFPSDFKLNDKMWWYASGWIRCRNQILNGNWMSTPFSKHDQDCFVGLVKMHEKTLNRLRLKLESFDVKLTDEQIREVHNDLVDHYLMNQNVIIGDAK